MSVNWERFVEVINTHQKILLTSHIRPDCDALGSELGMAGILDALGKDVIIVNGQKTPPNIAFIDPTNRIKALGEDISLEDAAAVDLLMVLDTSAWAQLGPMGDVLKTTAAKKIVVDHHVGEDDLGTEPFKNTSAEAAGRLVFEAAEALGVQLTPEIATPLFAALATDTGWFRYPSAGSGTYHIGAKLIEAGASPAAIYRDLYERDTPGRVRLRGEVLARIRTELDGRLAHTHIRKEDFELTGAIPSDTEDLVNMALQIDGTEAAVILVEQLTGGFKISFRSRCALDCSALAASFGGGGHKAAAGAFIDAPFEDAQARVLDAMRAAMP